MKTVKYSENDLASLLGEVEDKFNTHLKKAEAEQEETRVQKTAPKADLNKSEEEAVVVFNYNDSDIAEMNQMYGSMSKAEQKAHYTSIKSSLFGNEKPVKADPAKDLAKTEKVEVASITKSEEIVKTEDLSNKLEKSEAKYEDLQKNFQDLLSKLGGFIKGNKSAPKQKAITKIEFIAKSEKTEETPLKKSDENLEGLSKNEITRRLTLKARDPKLQKSDRTIIDNYYEERNKDIESIKHLL